jgi:hypothetical protein
VSEHNLLDKWIWTREDFERMGWHDSRVHALAFLPKQFELCLDIDYIVRWVNPIPPANHYTFWIAPATLVFENVWDLKMTLDTQLPEFSLYSIERTDELPSPDGESRNWLWTLDGVEGNISFRASGYKQFFRRPPLHVQGQVLALDERGGISFDRVTPPFDTA